MNYVELAKASSMQPDAVQYFESGKVFALQSGYFPDPAAMR